MGSFRVPLLTSEGKKTNPGPLTLRARYCIRTTVSMIALEHLISENQTQNIIV